MSVFTWSISMLILLLWGLFKLPESFIVIFLLFHLVFTLPAIYLHITYTLRNKGEVIEVFNDKIIVRNGNTEKIFLKEEMLDVTLFKSASLDKGGIPFSAMEYYRYVRINTKQNDEIVITCLMTLNLEDLLENQLRVPFIRRKGIAFLFWKY
ncbi:MAG: hypothetical protein ACK50A_02385 [Sphingobacteriaceae bacterium]